MRKKLSARLVESLPTPPARRVDYWDELLSGFGVRVSHTGRKTWFAMGRVDGEQKRHTIGTYPKIGLADARDKARDILSQMQLGTYQATEPEVEKPITYGEARCEYIDRYAKPNTRSWRDTERALGKFATFDARPLAEVRRGEVVRVLDGIIAKGNPTSANRAVAAIKAMFNWAIDRELTDKNPIARLKPPAKEVSRERFLSDAEIAAFWTACDDLHPIFAGYYRILLLTGQRREETACMTWSSIDFERHSWTISGDRAKNGSAHEVPLSSLVVEILKGMPRFLGSDLVFTTTGTTPISGFSKVLKQIQTSMGVSDWRNHDLRRTAATGMSRLKVQQQVVEKVLNHKTGVISGIAAVYNRHGYDMEKREALEKWTKHVRGLVASNAVTGRGYVRKQDIRSLAVGSD